MADTWTPQAEFADGDGAVTRLFAWAALDCPTGAAAVEPESGPQVLARLTARPGPAAATAGEEHVVMAWLLGRDGRKSRGARGDRLAEGRDLRGFRGPVDRAARPGNARCEGRPGALTACLTAPSFVG